MWKLGLWVAIVRLEPCKPSARSADWTLAGGIAAGVLADALVGDPRRGHPVALFGRAATLIERGLYADAKPRGAVFTACCEALAIGPALAAARISRRRPATRLAWPARSPGRSPAPGR